MISFQCHIFSFLPSTDPLPQGLSPTHVHVSSDIVPETTGTLSQSSGPLTPSLYPSLVHHPTLNSGRVPQRLLMTCGDGTLELRHPRRWWVTTRKTGRLDLRGVPSVGVETGHGGKRDTLGREHTETSGVGHFGESRRGHLPSGLSFVRARSDSYRDSSPDLFEFCQCRPS